LWESLVVGLAVSAKTSPQATRARWAEFWGG